MVVVVVVAEPMCRRMMHRRKSHTWTIFCDYLKFAWLSNDAMQCYDPDAKNPFTDPVDREYAEYIYESPDGGKTVTRRKFGEDYTKRELVDTYKPPAPFVPHSLNNEVVNKESMAHYFKYHEEEILKDIEEYVSSTYRGHYTGDTHEYRNVQTLDLMAARSVASGFCQANILKYGSRYGSKDGKNKKDLLKVIHYAMLLLHFDDHYGKPSMPSGNFEQMP